MKILHCDCCHAEVNDFGNWYNDIKPRSMYELNCIHDCGDKSYESYIFCQDCISKLIYRGKHCGKD